MAYGGLFKLTPGSAAAPRPRFASAPAALAFPYVKVPLMVMFPLGPQIVALYLEISAPNVRETRKERTQRQTLGKNQVFASRRSVDTMEISSKVHNEGKFLESLPSGTKGP